MSLQVLKNAGLLSLARFSGDALSLVLFIVLSRRLGPEGIGHYAFGLAIALMVYSWVNFGLEDFSIRECAHLDARERATLLGHLSGFQVVLVMVVVTAFGAIILISHASRDRFQVAAILSAYYIALAMARILFAPAFAQQDILRQAVTEMCCRSSSILAAIALIMFWNVPLAVALLAFPAGGLILLALATLSARRYNHQIRLIVHWQQIRSTAVIAWPFATAVLILVLQARISYIALGMLLGVAATGIYASVIKFLETGALPLNYLALSTYPSLSRSHLHDLEAFRRLADRLFRLSLSAGALLAWFLVLVLPAIIVPVLGKKFSSATSLLPTVGLLAILVSIDLPANRFLLAAKLQTLRVKFMVVGVVANLLLALSLIPFFGVPGAVAATLLGQAVMTTLSLRALFVRGLNPTTRSVAIGYFLSLCVALVVGGVMARLTLGVAWISLGSLFAMCAIWLVTDFVSIKHLFGTRDTVASPAVVE